MKIELPDRLSGDGFALRPLAIEDAARYAAAFGDLALVCVAAPTV